MILPQTRVTEQYNFHINAFCIQLYKYGNIDLFYSLFIEIWLYEPSPIIRYLFYRPFSPPLYDNVDDFFDQWDPSTEILMEKLYRPQGGLCWKINLIWSDSMRVILVTQGTNSLSYITYSINIEYFLFFFIWWDWKTQFK